MSELHHRLTENPEFEGILMEVADYRAPTPGVPGTYHLKASSWKDFDPFFPRWVKFVNRRFRIAFVDISLASPTVSPPSFLQLCY